MTDEIKRIEQECVGGGVRQLNRMVTAIYDGALACAGLKTSQFSVLGTVPSRGKVTTAGLTTLLQMDESTISRDVERMCARGWLRLKMDEAWRTHMSEGTE